MTDAAERTFASDAVRRLVLEARTVVERVRRLPAEASTEDDRQWAETTVRSLNAIWGRLRVRLANGDTGYLWANLSSIISVTVRLSDASDALLPAANEAQLHTAQLAADLHATMPQLVDEQRRPRSDLATEMSIAMQQVAVELDD